MSITFILTHLGRLRAELPPRATAAPPGVLSIINPNLFQNEMVISMMWNDQEYKKRTFLWLQKLVGKFVVLLFCILHGDLLFSLD